MISPCRLLIVDDHQMLTQSLAALLDGQPDLHVVGQLASGSELLAWLPKPGTPATADVLLLDLHLPPPDGLTLLPQLRQQWPELRVLVFSTLATPEIMNIVEAGGARGFVPKSADAGQLLEAIRAVAAGGRSFPTLLRPAPTTPSSDPTALLKLHRLSAREREVVSLVCEGLTTRDIADKLSLSEFTVTTHRRNILHKLELHNVAALTQFARDHGL
ncbi:response regulator transcription factor [Hymenobacter sp. BT175]|uniref:response regulator n=1 Tax=Hymenobacter translucens TaxID=2886507 RepID=UPI001D0F41CC|nr:response regulator transcription factor [Hymenobacter translucens]MCC2546772.1 response regulator transcription factor [Hymenobacter translucens]